MICILKRVFYNRFIYVFKQLVDKTEAIVVDKHTSNIDMKSWTKTSLWSMNKFRGIKTSFKTNKIK